MSTSLTLYKLVEQHRELERLADFDDVPAEVIRDTIEALQGDIQVKATSVAAFIRNLEASADMIDDAAKQMQARAARARKRAEAVKAYLLFQLQATGITRIESPEFVISVRNNPESVRIADGAEIPPEYLVQPEPPPPPPDKEAIKDALKAGRHIEGCYLEAGQRLEIRA